MTGYNGMIFFLIILLVIGVQSTKNTSSKRLPNLLLFDFNNTTNLSNWSEQSDTERFKGMSKATIDLYKTQKQKSAIFFSMLNPLSSGECFCGVFTKTQMDLSAYRFIIFPCTAQGNATRYRIILRHNGLNYPSPTFEKPFKVKMDTRNYVQLSIKTFKSYFRGSKLVNGPTLNTKNITLFGIQVNGGGKDENQQSGVSSLLLGQIKAKK